uniref:OMP373 n=1 Tax=Helicobacter acinonychis TaxID=212 RepID=A0A1M4NGD7_HELAC|nr:OMP373 [Helicobacter acinonychis]
MKNAGEIQKLSDTYEQLNNLLGNPNHNGTGSKASVSAINQAVNHLNKSTQNLVATKDNPAYHIVLLALRSLLGLWHSMGYAVIYGGYVGNIANNEHKNFHYTDENGNGTEINCDGISTDNGTTSSGTSSLLASKGVSLSIKQYEEIHEAYQILSQALKQAGLTPLNSKEENIQVQVTPSKD